MLFGLLSQCFQGVGLTEWTSVVAKQCPNDADQTKATFDECIRDYLEAVARFPNIGNQLIRWLCMAKKPALMPMHEFMRRQVQLLSYLESDYLRQTMGVPTAQEKSEQIFFAQPKAHQNKFADLIIIIKTIDAMIVVDVTTRTRGTASPTTRRMIASAITSRKRVTRPCTMTSPLCRAPAARQEKGVDLDLLCVLDLIFPLA